MQTLNSSLSNARLRPQSRMGLHHAQPRLPRNRHHSATLPLRSSPLAGPAVTRGMEVDAKGRSKGKRKSSLRIPASAPASSPVSFRSLAGASSRSHRKSKVSFLIPALFPSPDSNESISFQPDGIPKRADQRRGVSQQVSRFKEDCRPVLEQNWLTPTPTTPRFSRLGLAASGVVMPVRKEPGTQRRNADTRSLRSVGSVPSLNNSISSRAASLRRSSAPNLAVASPHLESMKNHGDRGPGPAKERPTDTKAQDIARVSGTIKKLWKRLSRKGWPC